MMDRIAERIRMGQEDAKMLAAIDQASLDALAQAIVDAKRIYVAGWGRAGNCVKILGMNCSQMALRHISAATTPPLPSMKAIFWSSALVPAIPKPSLCWHSRPRNMAPNWHSFPATPNLRLAKWRISMSSFTANPARKERPRCRAAASIMS